MNSITTNILQVTISTMENCRILTWYIQDLQIHLNTRPDVHEVFRGLLARDVTVKMNQIQQMFLQHPQHWRVLSGETEQEHHQDVVVASTSKRPNQIIEQRIQRPPPVNESWTSFDRHTSELYAAEGEYGLMWAARHKRETVDDGGLDRRDRRGMEMQNIVARSCSAAYISPLYMSNLSFIPASTLSPNNTAALNFSSTSAATASSASGTGGTVAARPRNIFFRANRAGSLESTASSISRCKYIVGPFN